MLIGISIASLAKCLFKCFAHLKKIRLFVFSPLSYKSFLYIRDVSPLQINLLQMSSFSSWTYKLLMVSFKKQSFLILIMHNISAVAFRVLCFFLQPKKFLLTAKITHNFSNAFFQKS